MGHLPLRLVGLRRRVMNKYSYGSYRFAERSRTRLIQADRASPARAAAALYASLRSPETRISSLSSSGLAMGGLPLPRLGAFMGGLYDRTNKLTSPLPVRTLIHMPYKHQAASYRTISGVRWESWGDFNEEASKIERDALKEAGWNVRRVSIGGGMYRLFRNPCSATGQST